MDMQNKPRLVRERGWLLEPVVRLLLIGLLMFWSLVLVRLSQGFLSSENGARTGVLALAIAAAGVAWGGTLLTLLRQKQKRQADRNRPK